MNGEAADQPERRQGHCPNCGRGIWADVRGEYSQRHDDGPVWTMMRYRILQCRGCDRVYFQQTEMFSEDLDYDIDPHTGATICFTPEKVQQWPPPNARPMPNWLPELRAVDDVLDRLVDELYAALNADLRVLGAIACRTVFDRAAKILKVQQDLPFARKLQELKAQGHIGEKQRETLEMLTEAGNAAAHRGWLPSARQLDGFVNILESFLHHSIILAGAAVELGSGIPTRRSTKGAVKQQPKTDG